jgi:exodeoxyribonuclease V alpha subunit
MIPIDIFYSLIQSIRDGAKLIMLGDIKQLETIGMGNILNDIIQSKTINVVELTKIHRQASDSGIISESLKASNKQTWIDKNFYGKKVVGKLKDME